MPPSNNLPEPSDGFHVFLPGRVMAVRRFSADSDTPVSLYSRLTKETSHSFLLESIEGGQSRARYSVFGADPDIVWQCVQGVARRNDNYHRNPSDFVACPLHDPIASLKQLIATTEIPCPAVTTPMSTDGNPAQETTANPGMDGSHPYQEAWKTLTALPPMLGSLFGYLGYEMIGVVETLPPPKPHGLGLPDSLMLRPQFIGVVDHVENVLILSFVQAHEVDSAPPGNPAEHDPRAIPGIEATMRQTDQALATYVERLMGPVEIIRSCHTPPASDFHPAPHDKNVMPAPSASSASPAPPRGYDNFVARTKAYSNTSQAEYVDMVQRAKEYILSGDAFQIVVGQRFTTPLALSPLTYYRSLRRLNPAPYLFLFDFGEFALAGASPEVLVRVNKGEITVRPLAGTRPRGQSLEEDQLLQTNLLADEKERAEHLMLIDLARNDVGKVARPGTVKVTELFGLEFYRRVMHIVSHVTGQLRDPHDTSTHCFRDFRLALCLVLPRSGRWKSSTNWKKTQGEHMPAASATSPPPATWIAVSPFERQY